MRYEIRDPDGRYDFTITGTSFIGQPKDGTALFVTHKMKNLLGRMQGRRNCLVFAEEGMDVPEEMTERNRFLFSADAQASYAEFITERRREEELARAGRRYTLAPGGYYLGENVVLGEGARIEPGCLIDHDVTIGKDARIGFGSRISNARIGEGFRCGEYAVIGTDAYYPTGDGEDRTQMPSFGLVLIGNHVDIGSHTVVERGEMGDTVIQDYVMIDAAACVGHEDDIGHHARITCGVKLGGIVTVGAEAYIGMNAVVKQRLSIGERAMVGVGSVVVTGVRAETKVFGSPARKMMI